MYISAVIMALSFMTIVETIQISDSMVTQILSTDIHMIGIPDLIISKVK